MHEPFLLAPFGTAKHAHGNAAIVGKTHTDMAPEIADLPFQYFSGNIKLFLMLFDQSTNRGCPAAVLAILHLSSPTFECARDSFEIRWWADSEPYPASRKRARVTKSSASGGALSTARSP